MTPADPRPCRGCGSAIVAMSHREHADGAPAARPEGPGRHLPGAGALLIAGIALAWSAWQLWIASPLPFALGWGIFTDLPARGIHLGFGLLLAFLMFPREWETRSLARSLVPLVLGLLALGTCLYVWLGYEGIVLRNGILLEVGLLGVRVPVEFLLGAAGMLLLLEGTRRSVGLPLVVVCVVFLLFSLFGQSMPEVISHKGVSVERLVGYQWLSSEAVFGIPIDVSVSYVFLFVLFGAFMDRAGAGRFFLDLSFGLVGRYRGGPAKAAIMASGMTGMVSGSSIANTVTTGAFTIPLMKRMGFPAEKAGAIEVAASTNGQLMPPIMGASAFIIAEFIGISYYDVIVHAAIPAFLSYGALFYISHLEACKLGLKGMPAGETPDVRATLRNGWRFLLPIGILVYLLLVERWSPGSAVFYSILLMAALILVNAVHGSHARGQGAGAGIAHGLRELAAAMIAGARSMAGVTAAVGAAGVIVGVVSSTGLNNALLGVVEAVSQGNFYALLALVALVCLILGMGLPTTANYIVVASLMAGVLVELSAASGLVVPLIAVHLFVLYFGLMADSTPPVCLAAYAASAISGADPMRTGVQSFLYDIRTSVLPLVFVFNPALLLIDVEGFLHGALVVAASAAGLLAFCCVTQGWMLARVGAAERVALLAAVFCLFWPQAVMNRFFPAYEVLEAPLVLDERSAAVAAERTVRLHVTRLTAYGERYKLFAFPPSTDTPPRPVTHRTGVALAPIAGDVLEVVDVQFMGPGEKAGLAFGDLVTSVDVERTGRPASEWAYLAGLLIIAMVLTFQRRRSITAP